MSAFPVINHIDDVLPAIAGRTEFNLKRGTGYVAIDYSFALPDSFDCPIRRECRGIKFDALTGAILARPYHKFFNVGERPETQPGSIDWSAPHQVLDKLDGSMIHPAVVGDAVVLMTRAGETIQSREVMRSPDIAGLLDWCRDQLACGLTPIFEWCSPRNQIVIRHEHDTLTLTGLRETRSGRYRDMRHLQMPCRPVPHFGGVGPLPEFLARARGLQDAEGYVVRFADGFMVKVKADAYVARHRARDGLMWEKDVLRLIFAGQEDDVLPLLADDHATALRQFAADVRAVLQRRADELADLIRVARRENGDDRKRFATGVVPTLPVLQRGPAFAIWSGGDPLAAVLAAAAKGTGSATEVDRIRPLIDGLRWTPPIATGEAA